MIPRMRKPRLAAGAVRFFLFIVLIAAAGLHGTAGAAEVLPEKDRQKIAAQLQDLTGEVRMRP